MRFAKTLVALSVTALVAFGLSGCSNSDDSSPSKLRPYVGAWAGTFTSIPAGTTTQQTGTVEITVDTRGVVTGALKNTTTGHQALLNAVATSKESEATVNGTITYPSGVTYQVVGALTLPSSNRLTGTIRDYDSQRQLQSTTQVDLTRR